MPSLSINNAIHCQIVKLLKIFHRLLSERAKLPIYLKRKALKVEQLL